MRYSKDFQHLLLENREAVPQTLLLEGEDEEKLLFSAKALAKVLLKTTQGDHPDLFFFAPEGKMGIHPMEAMQKLSLEAQMAPYIAPVKVFLLSHAHRMLPPSSNALLKTLEEPLKGVHFILLSSQPSRLLPTILSRCIRFTPYERESHVVYRNNLKNREFGKEAPQNFDAERATIAEGQGASEHQNSEAKPTEPKPDSSSCFGITAHPLLEAFSSSYTQFLLALNGWEEKEEALASSLELDLLFQQLLYTHRENSAYEYLFSLIQEGKAALEVNVKPRIVLEHLYLSLPDQPSFVRRTEK